MSTASSTTLTTARTVIVILNGDADWQVPLDRAARLAAATGKDLRVLLTDDDALVSAAALDCVRLVAWGGMVGAFDPVAARRLVRARRARLQGVLRSLAARHGIAAELADSTPAAHWAGCAALTFFGRRRRGTLLVVHAGTADTLDVAARLALEQHQEVRLLSIGPESVVELRRRFGHLLRQPPEALEEGRPLRRPSGPARVTTVVLDPAYLTARNLTLEALLDELRSVMGELREAATTQAPSPA